MKKINKLFDLFATVIVLGAVFYEHVQTQGLGAFCLLDEKKPTK